MDVEQEQKRVDRAKRASGVWSLLGRRRSVRENEGNKYLGLPFDEGRDYTGPLAGYFYSAVRSPGPGSPVSEATGWTQRTQTQDTGDRGRAGRTRQALALGPRPG